MFCFSTNYQVFLRNLNIAGVKWHNISDNFKKILIFASLRPLNSYSHENTDFLTDRCLFYQMSDILLSWHVNMINCYVKFTIKCCETNDKKYINLQETPALQFHAIGLKCEANFFISKVDFNSKLKLIVDIFFRIYYIILYYIILYYIILYYFFLLY